MITESFSLSSLLVASLETLSLSSTKPSAYLIHSNALTSLNFSQSTHPSSQPPILLTFLFFFRSSLSVTVEKISEARETERDPTNKQIVRRDDTNRTQLCRSAVFCLLKFSYIYPLKLLRNCRHCAGCAHAPVEDELSTCMTDCQI